MAKKYLTNVEDMRDWLRPQYRKGYIDRQPDNVIIDIYNYLKDGLK